MKTLSLRMSLFALLSTLVLLAAMPATAQPDADSESAPHTTAPIGPSGFMNTYAGTGYPGYYGNGGLAIDAQLLYPQYLAVDSAGNLYISDFYMNVIRKVTASTGVISVYAGTFGEAGYKGDKGLATKALLDEPKGIAFDLKNNLYIVDSRNNVIREVNAATGIITTIAGTGQGAGAGGFNSCPFFDPVFNPGTKALQASLCPGGAIAVDSNSNVYFFENLTESIQEISATTSVITLAVGGAFGYAGDGGPANQAGISDNIPSIAFDGQNNLYLADEGYCSIRVVNAKTGIIQSLVGAPGASGSGTCGLSGDGGPASKALIDNPTGLAVDKAGNVFIADTVNSTVRMVPAGSKNIYTIAGSYQSEPGGGIIGIENYFGNTMPATWGALDQPGGVAVNAATNTLLIADTQNSVIRSVSGENGLSPTLLPVASPSSGPVSGNPKVTLTAPAGWTIYYTTDGSLPTTVSTKYSVPFTVKPVAVILAFAQAPATAMATAIHPEGGGVSTPTLSGIKALLYSSVAGPTFKPAGPSLVEGGTIEMVSNENAFQSSDPAVVVDRKIYYTLDGTDPKIAAINSVALTYTRPLTYSGGKCAFKAREETYVSATDSDGDSVTLASAWSNMTTVTYNPSQSGACLIE